MVLQEKIPSPQPAAVASYDFVDVADRTGVRTFYLANSTLSGNTTYSLTQSVSYSSDKELSGNSAAGQMSDTDYDLTIFNLAQNIEGTAYANIPFKILPGAGTVQGYLVVHLRKWDGTTETEIASATSNAIQATGGGASNQIVHNLPLVIPSQTHFKPGESLRFTVEAWANAVSGTYGYGIDPKDRSESWMRLTGQDATTAQSSIRIPFKLDI